MHYSLRLGLDRQRVGNLRVSLNLTLLLGVGLPNSSYDFVVFVFKLLDTLLKVLKLLGEVSLFAAALGVDDLFNLAVRGLIRWLHYYIK